MQRIRLVLTAVLVAFAAGTAAGQSSESTGARARIKKVSRPMVWEPGPGGTQVPLWPAGVPVQRPESEKPEEVGNGSRLVAGRPWNWATYVSRPTMTIYPPKGPNSRAAILVLPGGGYRAVAMDLEGTEICDWMTKRHLRRIEIQGSASMASRPRREGSDSAASPAGRATCDWFATTPSVFLRPRSPQDRRHRFFCRRTPCSG